jgi:hypothetical protein
MNPNPDPMSPSGFTTVALDQRDAADALRWRVLCALVQDVTLSDGMTRVNIDRQDRWGEITPSLTAAVDTLRDSLPQDFVTKL